jgi:hypothetical protein
VAQFSQDEVVKPERNRKKALRAFGTEAIVFLKGAIAAMERMQVNGGVGKLTHMTRRSFVSAATAANSMYVVINYLLTGLSISHNFSFVTKLFVIFYDNFLLP